MDTIVVDNGSTDQSRRLLEERFPWVELCCLDKNYGFCRAVNEGIKRAKNPYVILLNNDTEAEPDFAVKLLAAIQRDGRAFSCQAMMLKSDDRRRIDSAGDFYCALGYGISRGKGKLLDGYARRRRIFSSCAGAAIYRKDLVEKLGGFDEAHFAYLEDMDLSYRAKLYGYRHWYEPEARVFHVGSGASGSRYNRFKVLHSAGNNIYLIYKNMPFFQILLNFPLLLAGLLIKYLFFIKKGLGKDYREGLRRGVRLCREHPERRVPFCRKRLLNYVRVQWELWRNLLLFLPGSG